MKPPAPLFTHPWTLFLIAISCLFLGSSAVTAAVNTGWQPVNISQWAQIDIPPGWTYGEIKTSPADPDTTTLDAFSPDGETVLQYVFDRNTNPASIGELRRAQDQYMNGQGFCLCQDQPSFTETEKNTAMKQIYIKGTNEGAVVCSGAYPGWGRYQYALIMNGPSSVNEYFDDLPDTLADHIRPITAQNATASA